MKRYVGQWVGISEIHGPGTFVIGDDTIPMVDTDTIDWSTVASSIVAWRYHDHHHQQLPPVPEGRQLIVVYTMGVHLIRTHREIAAGAHNHQILAAIYIPSTITATQFDRQWTCIDLALVWVAAATETTDDIVQWLLLATTTVITNHPDRLRAIAGADWWLDPLAPATTDMAVDVYTTFGADRAKYQAYAEAIELAIGDLDAPVSVMVVGAGTGLIVDAIAHLPYNNLVVVEKNPHCHQILREKLENWHNCRLHLTAVTPTIDTADIVVLEMLGSFGDNERFPEIRRQMPLASVSIPQRYALMVYPIHSHHPVPGPRPYVAKLTRYYPVASAAEIWHFDGDNNNNDNCVERHGTVTWTVTTSGIVNAIMGTFRAQLYGHVAIHNCPATPLLFVDGSYCSLWFPMVFPVADTKVSKGDTLCFDMWRYRNSDRCWYEWQLDGKRYNEHGLHFSF